MKCFLIWQWRSRLQQFTVDPQLLHNITLVNSLSFLLFLISTCWSYSSSWLLVFIAIHEKHVTMILTYFFLQVFYDLLIPYYYTAIVFQVILFDDLFPVTLCHISRFLFSDDADGCINVASLCSDLFASYLIIFCLC